MYALGWHAGRRDRRTGELPECCGGADALDKHFLFQLGRKSQSRPAKGGKSELSAAATQNTTNWLIVLIESTLVVCMVQALAQQNGWC